MARRGRPSNVRPAPFSITPAIVRGVLGLASRPSPAVVNVPIAPFKLVDRPRRSEDPRLARANDDASPVEHSRLDDNRCLTCGCDLDCPSAAGAEDGIRGECIDAAGLEEAPIVASGRLAKIDLNAVPSAMEQRAGAWHREAGPAPEAHRAAEAGKTWCGPCGGYVPANFGDGCISTRCPLRERRP